MSDTRLDEQFFIDAMSPQARADPYPLYEAYRGAEPLLRTADTIWFCLAHPEVSALLRNPLLSSNETRASTEAGIDERSVVRTQSLLFMDPPDHTRLRGLVSRAFTPRRVGELRAAVEAICDQLVDRLAAQVGPGETFDLIEWLAYPLPIQVICSLLGVPAADEATFTAWSRALARSIDPSVLRTAEDDAAIEAAEAGLTGYLTWLLAERRAAPGDDLLSGLLAVQDGGDRISAAEVLSLAMLLLVAGHETTVNLIGNGTLALLRAPDQLDILLRSPELVAAAVDELLRFDSPVQLSQRIVTQDMDLAGRRVRTGDEIVLMLGAANRDPAVFGEPARLDVTRADAHRHVAFGGGIHHCLGAALARLAEPSRPVSPGQRWSRQTASASTATAPAWPQISGLTSSASSRSPSSSASRDRPPMAMMIAARSAGAAPRGPDSSLATRRPSTSPAAAASVTGGSATARSASSSTSTPPAPTTIIGPSSGSRAMPRASSTPAGTDSLTSALGPSRAARSA
jgi:pimeloyl-[acyl-carrier protein] synthase